MVVEFLTKSMLGMFARCPQQFERRYINGEIIPPGIAARQGSAVHKSAEINHQQKLTTKVDMDVKDIQDAARDYYVYLVKEEGVFIPSELVSEKTSLLADGLDASTRLAKLYAEDVAPLIHPVMVEERIFWENPAIEIPLSGQLDVLSQAEDSGELWLPDFKTSGKSKAQKEADISLDLTMYAGLAAYRLGKWPDKVSLEVLVNNKTPKHQSLQSERGPNDFFVLMERVKVVWAQIKTGLFPPCSPDFWLCDPHWCGYFKSCKYSVKRRG
jgi:hypothetical protein